ncbi:sensor histidine kinase [Streptomyces sp. NPDC001262]|uniref:sensor histidine kinase n=1 Tax=unclassified Streptomyces TaxID=2593676 RepID=UPI00368B2E7A
MIRNAHPPARWIAVLRAGSRARRTGFEWLGLSLVLLAGLLLSLAALGSLFLGFTAAFPAVVEANRQLLNRVRTAVGAVTGTPVDVPYLPLPEPDMARSRALLRDPATARDHLWMLLGLPAALLLSALPMVIGVYGLVAGIIGGLRNTVRPGPAPAAGRAVLTNPAAALGSWAWLAVPAGLALFTGVLLLGPAALRAQAAFARVLLRPTKAARLARRVHHLAASRTDATDAQAAELRRIERDLHDGAQGRMVAVGMTLRTVEHLLDTDPAAARELVAEARRTSAAALAELRELVRGIHPPVLAERGLADALRAAALDAALPVTAHVDLPGRPPAPVEAAVYFAVRELLTNAAKHAAAGRAELSVRHRDGSLHITVSDDGTGGADPDRGSGLRGVERRLATFDGTCRVDSPPGGPTTIALEIPCALSSPRTSTSCGPA